MRTTQLTKEMTCKRSTSNPALMTPLKENYKTEIMEMARIACAAIPDDLSEQMDISDELFITIRDYLAKTTT